MVRPPQTTTDLGELAWRVEVVEHTARALAQVDFEDAPANPRWGFQLVSDTLNGIWFDLKVAAKAKAETRRHDPQVSGGRGKA
jgi:hypothetical protein